MKLKFKKQKFQDDAVAAVADLFEGQNPATSTFSVAKIDLVERGADGDLLGYGNKLHLTMEQIRTNLRAVQERNNLPITDMDELRFNIEMETGTGKTFVYVKTIYELNKRYGFNKFVILVPSRAIKEGVKASIRAMSTYFKEEYDGKKLESFVYDSKKLNQVRNYALSPNLYVMIVTIDAINKESNLFLRETEKMDKPAREYVADCRPIVISDESHNYQTEKRRTAIELLNPLFELQYSATHKIKMNTVYRLTPVDAYQDGIVKQICLANDNIEDDFNKAYMRLIEVGDDGRFYAKMELDVKTADGESRRSVKLYTGTNLKTATKNDKYDGFVLNRIRLGDQTIEFSNTQEMRVGQAIGAVDELAQSRSQIRRTIEAHLDNELRLLEKNIKVLSLFFIDEVAKYRDYDAPDQNGIYAKMFEEAYEELINLPRYSTLKARFTASVGAYHDGYFSQDKKKKGQWADTQGDTDADDTTYKLIMEKKEELLLFGSNLRFIWSHSVLKEGWDNPNVFQICTLIDTGTVFTCRQKIGRGLRLCVNQDGERIEDKKVNILTIVARESFAEFADKLQKEIEEETGVKFGVLFPEMFVGITYEVPVSKEVVKSDGTTETVTVTEKKVITKEEAGELVEHFRQVGYVDSRGGKKDTLKNDLKNGSLDIPARFENARDRLVKLLNDTERKVEVRQTRERVMVKRKDELFGDDRFIEIWNKIKQKSYYRINTRVDELMYRIKHDIEEMPPIEKIAVIKELAEINIEQSGVIAKKIDEQYASEISVATLPDVIRILSEATGMPRTNVGRIFTESGRIRDFINNPQKYIEEVQKIMNFHLRTMSIEGIIYTKIDGVEYSLCEVFGDADEDEIVQYLSNTVAVKPSQTGEDRNIYSHVIYQHGIEHDFAIALNDDPNVEFFFKIPDGFKIDTPVGKYGPDWAVYYRIGDEVKLYFIIETKGSTDRLDLRLTEDIKIHCGEQHFKGIGTDIKWRLAKAWDKVAKR